MILTILGNGGNPNGGGSNPAPKAGIPTPVE